MNFTDLSVVLVIAGLFGILARFLKQPLLIGFLVAGLLMSILGIGGDHQSFENLGKIGVALLLFLVGMEMNLKEIPTVGKVALLTGLGQIFFTVSIGFIASTLLGFSFITSIYFGVALSFSSTIIIVKLLSEKKHLESLYGKVSVGFLLVQDFVAILILMFLAGLKSGNSSIVAFLFLIFKAFVLFYLVWYLSKAILPNIFSRIVGNSQELLFVVSMAWVLGVSSFIGGPLGFSFEIGGFLAGLALSNLPEHVGIASKTRSLRDFFLTIFFVSLGSQMEISGIGDILPYAIIFSLIVLIGNPLIVMIIMGLMGHKSRTSFLASVTVAQISEFSFILISMGLSLGHLNQSNLTTIILVGVITMVSSTYLILKSEKVYNKFKVFLKIFEKQNSKEITLSRVDDFNDHVVLVGCDQIGSLILPFFIKRNIPIVVIDFNPTVFNKLSSLNLHVILGDVDDGEILEKAKINKSKIVICTIPFLAENLELINNIKGLKDKPIFIGSSLSRAEAVKLYEAGADYVLDPDIVAGEFLRHIFLSHGLNKKRIFKMGRAHFNRLFY